MSQTDLHTWALYYASRGWKVFPLKKHTPLPLTKNGLNDASSDPAQINEWWGKWPEANIAVNLAASGLMAFDVDPQNGGDKTVTERWSHITSTAIADTPSGGSHTFFTVPEGVSIDAKYGPGIDGKWKGYVLLQPSYRKAFKDKPDGSYKWRGDGFAKVPPVVPQDLHAVARAPAAPRIAPRMGSLDEVPEIRQLLEALDDSYYEEAQWLHVGMALHHWEHNTEGADGAGLQLFDEWSAEDPQSDRYQPDALDTLWARLSAEKDTGITLGSLKHWAGATVAQQAAHALAAVREAFASVPVEQRKLPWTTKPVEGFHVPYSVPAILDGMSPKLAKAWSDNDLDAICWGLAYETGGCCEHMLEVLMTKPDAEMLWPNMREAVAVAAVGRKDHKGVSGYTPERLIRVPNHLSWPFEAEQHQAGLLALEQSGFIKYSPGLGWFAWEDDKGKWCPDEGVSARRFLQSQFLACFTAETSEAKKVTMGSARKLNGVLACAQDHPALLVPSDAWDADSHILNTPDGAYDLRTGQMIDRHGLFVSKVTKVSPDFDMPTPLWDSALRSMCPDWEFLEQAMAYGLTGERTEELMFIAHGSGLNGKSKILGAVKGLMGDYAVMLNGSVLLRGNQHEDVKELAMLRGKRFVFVDELKRGGTWDDARVKKLATDATISVKLMHKDGYEAPALHKLYIATNHLPNVEATDFGMERRLALAKFPTQMAADQVDRYFGHKLELEWPGILARLIRLCAHWWAEQLHMPQSVRDNVAEYLGLNDDVQDWIDERCDVTDDSALTPTTQLFDSYAMYLEASKRSFTSKKSLTEALDKKGFKAHRTSHLRGIKGIRIRPQVA